MKRKAVLTVLDQIIRSGLFSAVLALAGVVAGAISSLYSAEIRSGGSELGLFLIACLIFFSSVGLREWRLGKVTEVYQRQLIDTVRTMPPQNLLNIYSRIYSDISAYTHDYVLSMDDDNPEKPQILEDAIRYTLDGMCTLVSAFENYPDGAVYSANIMAFREVEGLSPEEEQTLLGRLRFMDLRTLQGLRGVLDLQTQLSSSSRDHDSFAMDPDLKPLALPLFSQESIVSGKTRFLPGAPRAFVDGACLIEDASDMAELVSEECDVSPGVLNEIETYFNRETSKRIGSILSVRVEKNKPEMGVINIHCDRPNILSDQKQLYTYINLINPLTDIIYRLLIKHGELAGSPIEVTDIDD